MGRFAVPASASLRAACCSPACAFVCAQGSKRQLVALEKAEARAAKKATTDERDPKLPTSVPLPKDVNKVQNQHMATLLAEGVPAPADAADAAANAAAVAAAGPWPPAAEPADDDNELEIGA